MSQMLRPLLSRHAKKSIALRAGSVWRRYSSNSDLQPLRILFCGADEFSIRSLDAVRKLQATDYESVQSIDVVCRPDKRVGRGLKKVQEVPIKSYAKGLDLPIHQIDTFTGWTPPIQFDLVIAVSFGLLVPARILNSAKYGGLNVHPSLLPDLRGAAPVQHAILKGRSHTGVSIQTMHPTRFDHGLVLDQVSIPLTNEYTASTLTTQLGMLGESLLFQTLKKRSFIDPKPMADQNGSELLAEHAPKISPEDRHIDWSSWSAEKVERYDRALGKLWDDTSVARCSIPKPGVADSSRVTWEGPWTIYQGEETSRFMDDKHSKPGSVSVSTYRGDKGRLGVWTVDGKVVVPSAATVAGYKEGKGLETLAGKLAQLKNHSRRN